MYQTPEDNAVSTTAKQCEIKNKKKKYMAKRNINPVPKSFVFLQELP